VEQFRCKVIIEGKGTYECVLTPIGDAVEAPMQTRPNPSNGEGEVFTVALLGHEMKSGTITKGKRAGQGYELHSFRGSDNRIFQTFRNEDVSQLTPVLNTGNPVKLLARRNNFGKYDIVRIIGA